MRAEPVPRAGLPGALRPAGGAGPADPSGAAAAPVPVKARSWRGRPRSRRRLIALGAVALAVVGALAGLVVAQRDSAVATRSEFVPGTAEGGEPVLLDTTLYLPARTPAPAVLLAHGFGGSKQDLASAARDLARRGYVVLAYTARGFGASSGLVHLNAPDYEVADARALVSHLASVPEVRMDAPGDPRVGVAGSSYGGALALLAAGHDPRIDAVVADSTWHDLSRALLPNAAGDEPGVFKKQWAGVLFAAAAGRETGACGRLAPDVCAAYQRVAAAGEADEQVVALLRAASPASVLDRVHVPTLLIQGEQDSLFPLTDADANARGLAAHGTAVKEVWRRGGHDAPTSFARQVGRVDDWFGPLLFGRGQLDTSFEVVVPGGGISAETGQAVSRLLRADDAMTSRTTAELAVMGPPQTINAPAGGTPAAVTAVPGLGALLGDVAALAQPALADQAADSADTADPAGLAVIPGQAAAFASAPLPQGLLVAGSSTVTLRVTAHDSTDATLFASLVIVDPDGAPELPSGLVAPLRLTGLTQGEARTVSVALPGVVTRVPPGHRLVLVVSTTDAAYHLPTPPRSYTIALADPSAPDGGLGQGELAVARVDGRLADAEQPWGWLVAGGVAMALVLAAGMVAGARRRRRRRAVAEELATVPVVVEDLVKEYGDGYRAVDGVSFRVERGQVVGLLGPNGAGKTTVLRMLMGLIMPTAGRVRLFGEPVVPGTPALARVGAFVEGPGLLGHLSGRDNLRLYWAATGRPAEEARFETVLEIAGLGPSVERRVRTYSQGMRQRLAIAQAMLGLPELLVLDEPTNGLDPPQIAQMREVLRRYAATGRTVMISSHLLAEVEQTCSHVVVMHRGRLVAAGAVEEIVGAGGTRLAVADPEEAQRVLAAAGVAARVVPAQRSLEEVFLRMLDADS
ncbi:MAG: alpha/beta fold hydrolase [Frankia sp.]|nr:alpha/beta fold hydrolase [Frankia sp.]